MSPCDDYGGQYSSKHESEPSSIRDFGECRRQIKPIKACEEEETSKDEQQVKAPNNDGSYCHHTCSNERNEYRCLFMLGVGRLEKLLDWKTIFIPSLSLYTGLSLGLPLPFEERA
jgi:hypothetical protein